MIWQEVPIESIRSVAAGMKAFVLRTGWTRPFRAGQHVDLRLTAPDGYQAQRSYSIASSPLDPGSVELVIERLDGGEVSAFFHDVAVPGDTVELRGPIGGPFTWTPEDGGPLLLVGGGSGVVPLLSMLRLRAHLAPDVPAVLLYSARTAGDVIAEAELQARAAVDPKFRLMLHLTREPDGSGRPRGRSGRSEVAAALAWLGTLSPRAYLCGSAAFVTAMAEALVDLGVSAGRIRTERFGD